MMTDRAAIVTGGARGIGAATARRLALDGLHVVVADVDLEPALNVVSEILSARGSAEALRLDVADQQSWDAARTHLDTTGRTVAVIVNNAYTVTRGPAHELDDETWGRQIDVILGGAHRSVRTFHDHLTSARGAIVNVSSVHAISGWAGHPAYAAAKGALLSLTRQLAVEYGPHVRVNAVIPGAIETRAWDGLIDDAGRAEVSATIVAGRFGTPEEVALAIAFLASEGAAYITGTSLLVDGGITARS